MMKRRSFFLLLTVFFMFLYIGPVNFAPYDVPLAILTEQNILSDEPQIGEKFLAEFGETTYLGEGQYSYSTIMGVRNIWNGIEWVPWIYSQENKSLRIGEVTLTHLSDGALRLEGESGVIVGRLSWYTQYYLSGSWHNVTLDNYAFRGVEFSLNTVTVKQQFWSNTGELNITYVYSKNGEFKITVDVTNNAAVVVPIRIFWVAAQIKNIVGNYEMILQEFDGVNITIGIDIDGLRLTWLDVQTMDPNLAVNTVVDKPNRRAAVIFGDTSRSLGVGQTYTLDPSVSPVIGADEDDDSWVNGGSGWVHAQGYTTCQHVYAGAVIYYGQSRYPLAIEQGATITSATWSVWEDTDGFSTDLKIHRLDLTNCGALEGNATRPVWDNATTIDDSFDGDGADEWKTWNVTALVQKQVNLADWSSGYYIALLLDKTVSGSGNYKYDDYQNADSYHSYMNVTYTTGAANNAPVNDQTPTLDNADDTDNMYAQYREYQMTVYVSDADGYADIDYVEVSLWDNGQSTEYFRFRYDEDTDTFTEEYDSGTVVSLNTGSSSATETGDDIDATFYFTIDWDFADLTDIDLECYVVDDEPESDSDFYEANFDVETRLDYSVAPSVTGDDSGTVDRGDFDESFSIGGTLIYYGSTDDNPASNQIDVWVSASEYGSNVGPWSDTTLTAGAFVVTCYADNALGQDTYTIKPVLEGAGSGGASQYYTTDETDTYIADIVQVQSYTVSDSRVNINDNVNVDVTLYYDYDDSDVTDGTVTINGESAVHQGSGVWRITVSESTVQANTYNTVAVTGNTHGITTEDQNGQSTLVIWDRLVVTLSADSYAVVNGTQVNITISIIYDYDDSAFTYYNLSMTRDAVFWRVFNHANSSLCNDTAADVEYTYTVNALNNETTYGITAFTSNSINIEWSSTPPTTTTPTVTSTVTTGLFFQLFLSLEMWSIFGPALIVICGFFVAKKDKGLGIIFFIVECLVVYQYFMLVDVTPYYWWHIIVLMFGGIIGCGFSLSDR